MIVRDRSKPRSEWLGRPTDAAHEDCPCRPCWHPHDMRRTYSEPVQMRCATRENSGCPYLPRADGETGLPQPFHRTTATSRRRCRQCGAYLHPNRIDAMEEELEKLRRASYRLALDAKREEVQP